MHRKATIVRLLKKVAAAPQGLSQNELLMLNRPRSAAQLDIIRDTEFPAGLKGLVREEVVPSARRPRVCWFATRAGRKLLIDLESNPDALPVVLNRGHRESQRAKRYAASHRYKKKKKPENYEKNMRRY